MTARHHLLIPYHRMATATTCHRSRLPTIRLLEPGYEAASALYVMTRTDLAYLQGENCGAAAKDRIAQRFVKRLVLIALPYRGAIPMTGKSR
jgi:hypothetical protein